jgi:uncharacterized glyoxalase superfamily protein PhnB
MPDPFEALREPTVPVAPDPLFAAHLRARLARALSLPKGVTVSNVTLDRPAGAVGDRPPEPAIVPYLIVADARRALDWYAEHLGARRRGEPMVMADGRVGHAEMDFGGSAVFLADEPSPGRPPHSEVAAPGAGAAATVSLTYTVADVDRVVDAAVNGGATLERAAADHPYGRNAVVRDPFGHRWIVSGPVPAANAAAAASPAPATATSHIAYMSLWVPDADRAAQFFGEILGWRYRPGNGPQRHQVSGQSLHHGLFGTREPSTLFLCFGVADLDAAVERVRAAGGTATPPTVQPFGRVSDCTDNQGTPFALVETGDDSQGSAPGQRHGDVAYLTMEVVDSGHARAFYSSVLGWRFRPARVMDGWEVDDVVPMVGMKGGEARATTVPMYQVDDIAAAVARIRARGGSATDPERQPYGVTSACTDDQGTRFYLGQF